jgi:hypothetical protein
MQFSTKVCSNNYPPKITNTNFTYETCAGQQICFDVTTDDKIYSPPAPLPAPAPDSVRLAWNNGIRGATFTIQNKDSLHQTGRFCWTPDTSKISTIPYYFVAIARDDACPLNAKTLRAPWKQFMRLMTFIVGDMQ